VAQFKRNNTRRGELSVRSRRKEDKGGRIAWGFNFLAVVQNNIALSAPATALLSFQNSVGRPKPYASRNSKQEQGAKTPPSSSRAGDETSHAFDAAAARKIFLLLSFQVEKNKTLTCALVAEQSRTSPARSGSTVALDRVRMPEG